MVHLNLPPWVVGTAVSALYKHPLGGMSQILYCSGATCELFIWKIPQNVWAENLRNMFSPVILASLLLALLLNTSRSYTLLRIICLVSTVVTHS